MTQKTKAILIALLIFIGMMTWPLLLGIALNGWDATMENFSHLFFFYLAISFGVARIQYERRNKGDEQSKN